MRRLGPLSVGLAGVLTLAGCGADSSASSPAASSAASSSAASRSAPDLAVRSAYMPQPVSDSMAAGFLTVTNRGGTADELTSASCDAAGLVTVHETVDGTMREVEGLKIPARGSLVLASGGNHLMFEELTHRPKQGETVSVELRFAHSDPMTVEMPVKPATYRPDSGH